MKPLILDNISIGLAGAPTELISDFSLVVQPGEIITVMGRSGIGKSTLMAFISGHLGAQFRCRGRVFVGDREITAVSAEKRKIGILFQDDLLFPHLSVGDNLAFGLDARVRGGEQRRRRVAAALEIADLHGFAERDPATLSGGQRARVALMRTLLAEPEALLLDEPFSKLDNGLREEFRGFVFSHTRRSELPVLMVTHDEADADAAGGRRIPL